MPSDLEEYGAWIPSGVMFATVWGAFLALDAGASLLFVAVAGPVIAGALAVGWMLVGAPLVALVRHLRASRH